jgi:acyl carrier protein
VSEARRALVLALAALLAPGCPSEQQVPPQPSRSEPSSDARAVRAIVASYLKRAPEEIEWNVSFAAYGLDELDASEVVMIVEEQLDVEIRNQDLEKLVGSSDVNGLHQRLTTRALAQLVEMGRTPTTPRNPAKNQ